MNRVSQKAGEGHQIPTVPLQSNQREDTYGFSTFLVSVAQLHVRMHAMRAWGTLHDARLGSTRPFVLRASHKLTYRRWQPCLAASSPGVRPQRCGGLWATTYMLVTSPPTWLAGKKRVREWLAQGGQPKAVRSSQAATAWPSGPCGTGSSLRPH